MKFGNPIDYFTFEPNWIAQVRYGGRFNTAIMTGLTGHEQRSMIWKSDRRKQAYQLAITDPAKLTNLRRRVWKKMGFLWGMPVWTEGEPLWAEAEAYQNIVQCNDITNKDFYVGERVIIIKDYKSFEVGVIQSIVDDWEIHLTANLTNSWPAGSMVYPVFNFLFTLNLDSELLTREDIDMQIEAEEIWVQSTSSSSSSSSSSDLNFSSSSSSSSSSLSSSSSSFSSSSYSSSSSSSSESVYSDGPGGEGAAGGDGGDA